MMYKTQLAFFLFLRGSSFRKYRMFGALNLCKQTPKKKALEGILTLLITGVTAVSFCKQTHHGHLTASTCDHAKGQIATAIRIIRTRRLHCRKSLIFDVRVYASPHVEAHKTQQQALQSHAGSSSEFCRKVYVITLFNFPLY